jgi:hypothetical protein
MHNNKSGINPIQLMIANVSQKWERNITQILKKDFPVREEE